jgi:hypothetical protein
MADDLKKTGRQDDERINVDQDHEVTYWSQKLGVRATSYARPWRRPARWCGT